MRKNENELKEKATSGVIEWSRFGHFTDKKTDKYYTYNAETLGHDFTEKGGFINWIIKRTDARNEEERKEAEEGLYENFSLNIFSLRMTYVYPCSVRKS